MIYKYLVNEDKIVDVEPLCRYNKFHDYERFRKDGQEDERVELCGYCGLIRLDTEKFYTGVNFRIFILRQYAELEKQSMEIKIKNEMDKRENIQIFGD